jgi:hypothetical protein
MKDAKITAIEIKSSMSKFDVYTFDRKVSFYEARHHVTVDRKNIIMPLLDPRAEAAGVHLRLRLGRRRNRQPSPVVTAQ